MEKGFMELVKNNSTNYLNFNESRALKKWDYYRKNEKWLKKIVKGKKCWECNKFVIDFCCQCFDYKHHFDDACIFFSEKNNKFFRFHEFDQEELAQYIKIMGKSSKSNADCDFLLTFETRVLSKMERIYERKG